MSGEATSGANLQLTPLESDILEQYHRAYLDKGFPTISELRVECRENTGAGRYTDFSHDKLVDLPDGWHGVGKYSQFDMEGLPAGATYVLLIANRKIKVLEIAVNGDYDWDGAERQWMILDPETGSPPG